MPILMIMILVGLMAFSGLYVLTALDQAATSEHVRQRLSEALRSESEGRDADAERYRADQAAWREDRAALDRRAAERQRRIWALEQRNPDNPQPAAASSCALDCKLPVIDSRVVGVGSSNDQ